MGLKEGTELIIINNEKKELKILPLLNGTTKINILMSDAQGSLASVLKALSMNNADILLSASKTIDRGSLAEWSAIMDVSACKDIKKMENDLKATGVVKKLRVDGK